MDKSISDKFFTPKFFLIGIGSILLVTVIAILSIQNANKPQSITPTTSPPQNERVENLVTPPSGGSKPVAGQVLVKFKPGTTNAQVTALIQPLNATIKDTVSGIGWTVIKVPVGQEENVLKQIENNPIVDVAGRDQTVHAMFVPNDPNLSLQWGLKNTGQNIKGILGEVNADIGAEAAWDITKGSGIKVAVVDSGINLSHPEFAGKIVAQKAFITTSIEDNKGHGTHVAGIMAAGTNNGQGIAGTCPDCQIVVAKVLDDTGSGPTSVTTQGITWAVDQGAKVVNMSFGVAAADANAATIKLYQDTVDYATQKGAVVVAAAGNDNSSAMEYPAGTNGVVTVGSLNNQNLKSSFSNYGSYVEVTAPGTNIYSTLPNHANGLGAGAINYGYASGTSMASPMVAGVVALIWASPYGTSNKAVIDRLYATADKIAGTGTYWTVGRVNAAKAVGANDGGVPSPNCVGGSAVPPCATLPPSPTTQPGPTVIATTIPGITTEQPTIAITQPAAPEPTVLPTPGGSNNPCPTTNNKGAANRSSLNHNHPGTRVHSKVASANSFFDFFFNLLFKIIEWLLQLIGGAPIGQPQPCTPQPTIAPTLEPTTIPVNIDPTTDPSASTSPTIGVTLNHDQ